MHDRAERQNAFVVVILVVEGFVFDLSRALAAAATAKPCLRHDRPEPYANSTSAGAASRTASAPASRPVG